MRAYSLGMGRSRRVRGEVNMDATWATATGPRVPRTLDAERMPSNLPGGWFPEQLTVNWGLKAAGRRKGAPGRAHHVSKGPEA